MRGRSYSVILILAISLCIYLPDTSANPSPLTNFEQLNMVVLSNNSVIRFESEIVNITVGQQNGMDVHASYTLSNPTNQTVVQDILLPYVRSYMRGFIGMGENSVYYLRFDRSFVQNKKVDIDDPEILEKFDLANKLQVGGFVFNVTFGPFQTGILDVYYTSEIGSKVLISVEPKKEQYRMIYFTRSAALWKHPLDSAMIDVWIDRNIITDYPTGGGDFELLPDKAHVHFQYRDWMPRDNIDLTWNCTPGQMFGTERYGDLREVSCQSFDFGDRDTSFNISILDQSGEPLRFLNDLGEIVQFQNYNSIRIWPWPFRIYLVEAYTPPGDITLLIEPVNCSDVRITLDGNTTRYDLGNITLHPIPVEKEAGEISIFLSAPMLAIYIIGATFLLIAIAVSILTFKERTRRKMAENGTKEK